MENAKTSEAAPGGSSPLALSGAPGALSQVATVSDVDSLSLRMVQRSLATEADSKVYSDVCALLEVKQQFA